MKYPTYRVVFMAENLTEIDANYLQQRLAELAAHEAFFDVTISVENSEESAEQSDEECEECNE